MDWLFPWRKNKGKGAQRRKHRLLTGHVVEIEHGDQVRCYGCDGCFCDLQHVIICEEAQAVRKINDGFQAEFICSNAIWLTTSPTTRVVTQPTHKVLSGKAWQEMPIDAQTILSLPETWTPSQKMVYTKPCGRIVNKEYLMDYILDVHVSRRWVCHNRVLGGHPAELSCYECPVDKSKIIELEKKRLMSVYDYERVNHHHIIRKYQRQLEGRDE